MLNLGIIGAENSHSYAIGKTCNIDKAVAMRATVICGETAKFAKEAAEKGGIPHIVKDYREMLGQVDGVMIDHRHPGPHYEVAKFFVENKVPTFVDKPFTWKLSEAKRLLDLAKKTSTPVTTFSAIPIQTAFQQYKKELKKAGNVVAINSTGVADLKSKYGGVFFYGVHQVDAVIELMGTDVKRVELLKSGDNGVGTILYRDGRFATINFIKAGATHFHWRACTDKQGPVCYSDTRDANPYMGSVKLIFKLLKKGEVTFTRERMLAPVAVLEALQKSLDTGKPVNVAKL
jgi:predicted dehydrogenase